MTLEGDAYARITKAAGRESMRCTLIGYAVALLIILPISIGNARVFFVSQFIFPFFLVSLTLFIAANVLGRIFGGLIYRNGNRRIMPWLAGVATAWLSVIVSTILGCLPAAILETDDLSRFGQNLFDYVGKPMIWTAIFGSIPSTLLGLYFAARIKRLLPLP